jgi:UDP-glucose 4-epimerase
MQKNMSISKGATVLITGANGFLGRAILARLQAADISVRATDLGAAGGVSESVYRKADITRPEELKPVLENATTVIHVAGLAHIFSPDANSVEKYERINVGGTATVVEAVVKAGVKRIVLASTIAVYGASDGCVLNEASPTQPDTFYAQTKLAAEEIVLNARDADGQLLGTVLRLGAVYGSRIKGNYERLTRALARHRFIPIGNGFNRRTLVYDKDVGRAAALSVTHPAAAGRVFNVTDGTFPTLNEIIESICSALGRKPPRLSLPVGPTRILAGLIEKGAYATGIKPPVTREMVDKYTEDIVVDGSLIQKELGFVPQYDLKTGWEETIREMQA